MKNKPHFTTQAALFSTVSRRIVKTICRRPRFLLSYPQNLQEKAGIPEIIHSMAQYLLIFCRMPVHDGAHWHPLIPNPSAQLTDMMIPGDMPEFKSDCPLKCHNRSSLCNLSSETRKARQVTARSAAENAALRILKLKNLLPVSKITQMCLKS